MMLRVFLLYACLAIATQQQLDLKTSKFAVELFKATASDQPNENVIISPFSVQTVLALAYMGATGETASEMSQTMHLGEASKADVADFFEKTNANLGQSSTGLQTANKVYLKGETRPMFRQMAEKFHAEAEQVDFSRSKQTADQINRWVASKTGEKVKDLIDPSSLDANTRMILVNALYFKGSWLNKFEKRFTHSSSFWISQIDQVSKDMMVTGNQFLNGYISYLNAQAIELKYANSDVSMFVLLPVQRTGLAQLEAKLQEIDFKNMTDQMTREYVHVLLPRFKVEFKADLSGPIQKLGMVKMFSDTAEFDDLLEAGEPLKVSKIVHKAVFEIDEDGAEAAAASGLEIVMRSPSTFHADHPFLYFLRRGETVLFMGRFVK